MPNKGAEPKSEIQPQLLRKMTVRKLLDVLMARGPCSRAELTRQTGISAPTVSKAVAGLLEIGLVEEGDVVEGGPGRPGRLLRLATSRAQVVGVVLDARKCRVVAAGLDGILHADTDREFPTPGTYEGLLSASVEAFAAATAARPEIRTLGVGVSTPGLINCRTQEVVFSPNLGQTNGHGPARDLSARLGGLPCVALQETHGLCLAERVHGGARGLDNFAMLDVSTGLGLGVWSGGAVLEGHSGLAGELGHVTMDPVGRLCGCGNRGCLETLATDTALATRVSDRLGRPVDIEEVITGVRSGQLLVREEIQATAEYLAIAMAAVINLFNPATLFVHGRLLEVRDGLFDEVVALAGRRALRPSFEDCRIIQARGSKRQGAVNGIVAHLTDTLGPSWEG